MSQSARTRMRGLLQGLACVALLAAPFAAHASDPELEAEQRAILSLISPRPGETICDLGCGSGTWTTALARAVGSEGSVLAVDIDPRQLERVRKRVRTEGIRNVKVIQSLPDDPLLPVGELDAVFLNDVIDYVAREALAGFLDGIRRSLKPTGRLILRDPNGGADRVISECYRAGFSLVEAKIPLPGAPKRAFRNAWYALKLRVAAEPQHALLPRLGKPAVHRTRLHLAEELFRAGLISRKELRRLWETIRTSPSPANPKRDEAIDLIRAAAALGVVDGSTAEVLHGRAEEASRAGEER